MQIQNEKIRIEGLYKIFGKKPDLARTLHEKGMDKDTILARTGQALGVSNASFSVYEGETLVVMGLSGSGKSTLIRCLNRLIEPSFGSIFVDGQDITTLPPEELRLVRQKKFGMVFQSFALFPHKTVAENVEYGLELQAVDKGIRQATALEVLESVGLAGWEDYYPDNLSGGMKQRVGLARALAVDPDILLMDEAFSALDPLIRTDMQDELLSLESRYKKTIVFITHDLDEALKMGDRIVLMKDGSIVQIGSPDEILSHPADEYVERFVRNVDRSKVLTARDVMLKPRPLSFVKDGPRVALKTMKDHGLSGIFITQTTGELVGYLSVEEAARVVKTGEPWLDQIQDFEDLPKAGPDDAIRDLFPFLADKNRPVAVIGPGRKLVGLLLKGSVFAALAEGSENGNGNGNGNSPQTHDAGQSDLGTEASRQEVTNLDQEGGKA